MQERLDILNENGEKTGKDETYENVHLLGLIHRVVHVWLMNSKKQFLLQKRSKNKCNYPNHWDTSAAGHVSFGETSLEAAKREVKEELGVSLADSAFKFLDTIRSPKYYNVQ